MNTQNTPNLPEGSAPEAQIAAWKAHHNSGIYAVEVGGHIAYFKNPTRHDINYALARGGGNAQALDVYEALANLTFLGGSEAILQSDPLFLGLCTELRTKIEGAQAKLVNL
ncbi:MAG: hypothetical protein EBX41_00595 [Chitinophagia bacterium]|nr:hypothetical protein [Chitinophagia bacterium]